MKLSSLFAPPPFSARHWKRTFVASPEDEASRPTRAIVEFALGAVRATLDVDVSDLLRGRPADGPDGPGRWLAAWPGEHYRLLAGIVAHLQPKTVVEIGTDKGLSALSMLKTLGPAAKLVTFDLLAWDAIPGTCLVPADFESERFEQRLENLADPAAFARNAELLSGADLLFVDGPKDRVFEPAFLRNLGGLTRRAPAWVVFDDIRDRNMLRFWRELTWPKLDLSSFGHWTGTGLALWA